MDNSESRVREEARRRDHRQLYELVADFLEEVRRSGRPVVSEPLALLSTSQVQVNQVSPSHLLRARFQRMPGFTAICIRRGTGGRQPSTFPTID